MPLARLEAKIATLLLERFQEIRRVPNVRLEGTGSNIVFGVSICPSPFRLARARNSRSVITWSAAILAASEVTPLVLVNPLELYWA